MECERGGVKPHKWSHHRSEQAPPRDRCAEFVDGLSPHPAGIDDAFASPPRSTFPLQGKVKELRCRHMHFRRPSAVPLALDRALDLGGEL